MSGEALDAAKLAEGLNKARGLDLRQPHGAWVELDAAKLAEGLNKARGLDLRQPHGAWVEDPRGVGKGYPVTAHYKKVSGTPSRRSTHSI